MKSIKGRWAGSFSAIVTPFSEQGDLDERALRANVRMTVDEGTHGLVIGGHNGEAHLMTDEERIRVTDIALEEVAGRIPVLAGTGGIRTDRVIALSRQAEAQGVDGVMVESPYFMTPKGGDLISHFAHLSDAVTLPIMIYNNPARSGVDLDIGLMTKISESSNIVAIKETSGSFERIMRLILNLGDRIRVFVGASRLFGLASVQMGAAGFVDGMSQVVGGNVMRLYESAIASDRVAEAVAIQRELFKLGEILFHSAGTSPATIKDAMRLLGRPGGFSRAPLRAMEGDDLHRFERALLQLSIVRRS